MCERGKITYQCDNKCTLVTGRITNETHVERRKFENRMNTSKIFAVEKF